MMISIDDIDGIIDKYGLRRPDDDTLRACVENAVSANPKVIADIKRGRLRAVNRIVGLVLRELRGADSDDVRRMISETIGQG